jgi:hypothetical protein
MRESGLLLWDQLHLGNNYQMVVESSQGRSRPSTRHTSSSNSIRSIESFSFSLDEVECYTQWVSAMKMKDALIKLRQILKDALDRLKEDEVRL